MLKIFGLLMVALLLETTYGALQRQNALLGSEYYDQDGEEEYVQSTPCNGVRPGDPDLTMFDIISSYRFDQHQYEYAGVQEIIGSTGYQTAYHFEEYSNMTIESSQAFPKGVPDEFSFECTFRVPQVQPRNEWYLFELENFEYESLMSVTINPIFNTIDFSLPKFDGSMQTISFQKTELFDRSWHKVNFGVSQDGIRLWVDCKPVPNSFGFLKVPIDVRGPIDSSEGSFTVARDCKTRHTVPIDLQWMIFSCDLNKPDYTNCADIPQYATAPKGAVQPEPPRYPEHTPETTRPPLDLTFLTSSTHRPWIIETTPAALQGEEVHKLVCPEQCPRGPPGPAGPPGPQGLMGIPGNSGSHIGQLELGIAKGERGEAGLTGLTGKQGVKGDNGLPGRPGRDGAMGTKGEPGVNGLPGPQGLPGIVVGNEEGGERIIQQVGLPGVQGEPGIPGAAGEPGPPGLPGDFGLPGTNGAPGQPGPAGPQGDRGLPGLDGGNGAPGLTGPMGPQGQPGPPGPGGYSGTVQEVGRNVDEREIREICMSVVRDYISEISASLAGPPGPPGRRGITRHGPPGPQGIQGELGPRGSQGERGYPGVPGLPGPQGDLGLRGPEGQKGERGIDGVGREGPMGQPGPQGPEGRGVDGMPGRPGDRGDTGRPGEPGARGDTGQPGVCPDCNAYQAAYAYPLLLAQQQQNNKGPPNYSNKGPQNYYNKGP